MIFGYYVVFSSYINILINDEPIIKLLKIKNLNKKQVIYIIEIVPLVLI